MLEYITPGKYLAVGTGSIEDIGGKHVIPMYLHNFLSKKFVIKAYTPIGTYTESGINRCGNHPCPVRKNMGNLGNEPLGLVVEEEGTYFVNNHGQMICDNLCGTDRTKCGFNLQIHPVQPK